MSVTNSFFEGNSGVLNLLQNSERGFTTGAHEIGHMMGFSSQYTDNTHLTDEFMQEGFNVTIPIMYSGGTFTNQLDQRVRTSADVQGLNIWNAVWEGNGYIGESINNEIRE